RFGQYESMRNTLEKDPTAGTDDALLDIYRKLRPGEPPTKESAQALLENLYFNPKRYDLAKVGRYKINKKLGLDTDYTQGTLTEDDIVETIDYLVRLHAGDVERESANAPSAIQTDDIELFGNRRLCVVGELSQNQVGLRLARMARVVRERIIIQAVEATTPQTRLS